MVHSVGDNPNVANESPFVALGNRSPHHQTKKGPQTRIPQHLLLSAHGSNETHQALSRAPNHSEAARTWALLRMSAVLTLSRQLLAN